MVSAIGHLATPAATAAAAIAAPPAPPRPQATPASSGEGDVFIPQYAPQVYAAAVSGAAVLESQPYDTNVAFPPLLGSLPNVIPSLPPISPDPAPVGVVGTHAAIAHRPSEPNRSS